MMIKLTLTIEDIDIDVAEYTLVSLPSDTEKGIVIWSKTDINQDEINCTVSLIHKNLYCG